MRPSLCGCYCSGSNSQYLPRQWLPLVDSQAHTTILSATSKTVLKQTFSNRSISEAIEKCTYTFPLYDGVSVVGFTCTVGHRVLQGVVKEKAKAKQIFDSAAARGETAGLLRQDLQASDVFSTDIGNIPAGEKIIVEITYVSELKQNDVDSIRFTIPTSLAPRYLNGPRVPNPFGAMPLNAVNADTLAQGGRINITVDINLPDGLSVKSVQSPSHPIAVALGTLSTAVQADPVINKASATLSLGSSSLERDFVLIVHSKDTGIPKALLETHPTIPNHRALMATLVSRFSLPPVQSEIVFVADRSGSMASNIPMLISAMKVFLKSMPTGVKFNICSFGTEHKFLWPKSKSYSSETVGESIQHVLTFGANFGGTETFAAIKATADRRLGDIPLEIILLTDGDIWNQAPLFAYVNEQVEKSQGNIRVFPLGIGTGVSHSLIEGLARAGNGFAQAVQQGERFDDSVVRMLRGALTPHITDYTLEVKYEQDDDDFEVIEKVTGGMKNLLVRGKPGDKTLLEASEPVGSDMKMRLSDRDLMSSKGSNQKPEEKIQPPISLFDSNVEPDPTNYTTTINDGNPCDLPNLQVPKLLQAPHKIPSLVPFSRTTVYLLMGPETIQRNPTSVVLRATSFNGPLVLEIPVEVLPERDQTIHQLAARKASQDLEESRGWIYDGEATNGVLIKDEYPIVHDRLVEREAIRLGETYQVANKWCSFVAVSTDSDKIAEGTAGETERAASSQIVSPYIPAYHEARQELTDLHSADLYRSASIISHGNQAFTSASFAKKSPTSFFGSLVSGTDMSKRLRSTARSASSSFSVGSSAPPPPVREAVSRTANSAQAAFSYGQPASSNSLASPCAVSLGSISPNLHSGTIELEGGVYNTAISEEAEEEDTGFGAAADGGFFSSIFEDSGPSMVGSMPAPVPQPAPMLQPRSSSKPPHPVLTPRLKHDQLQPQQSAKPHAIITDADIVLAIIDLQGFDGSWAAEKELSSLLGFEFPKAPEGVEEKAWITALVIKFLEIKMGWEEGVWGLVVDKARAYMQMVLKDGIEELERKAGGFVEKK